MSNIPLQLTGKVFGKLTAISPTTERKSGQIVWLFKCVCGNFCKRVPGNVKRPGARVYSCGCATVEAIKLAHTTHGQTNSLTYRIWSDMKSRCFNPTSSIYKFYGGRGITVCERWASSDGFTNFIADMKEIPGPEYSIERINVDGNYEPANCKWLLRKQQARNTRSTMRAPDGTPVIDLAEKHGLSMSTVSQRIHRLGWSLEKALTTPKYHNGVIPMPERLHSRVHK